MLRLVDGTEFPVTSDFLRGTATFRYGPRQYGWALVDLDTVSFQEASYETNRLAAIYRCRLPNLTDENVHK